jgi:2-C-methyl-D-erythritol 4-phosphate cytidylyltransferase
LGKPEYALIVAGGKGTRFKSDVPKQFLEFAGKPVLLHTIEAFLRYSQDIKLVVVLPSDQLEAWEKLKQKHKFNKEITIVTGGLTRFQSVRNGLQHVPDNAVVAIHDGVRPLVSRDIIATSFQLASAHGSAIASVPLKESIRISEKGKSKALDRSKFRMIQTPQTFDAAYIREAYNLPENTSLTDDASVAERAGQPIFLFEGSYDNIKITTPDDLLIAEVLQKRKENL